MLKLLTGKILALVTTMHVVLEKWQCNENCFIKLNCEFLYLSFLGFFPDVYLEVDKGQLISKFLFGAFNSPKEWTKTIWLEVHSSKVIFFVLFGKIEDTKKLFQN